MQVFDTYSQYYDLLYRDKDYRGEVDFVSSLIREYRPGAAKLLELGCGTGRHAVHFLEQGYQLIGIDRSTEMLRQAEQRICHLGSTVQATRFVEGDICSIRLGETFDVAVSLFHVVSYQVTNGELQEAFATAWEHLQPGGIFIFDCWHGPGVLTDRPATRVKRLTDEQIEIIRIAEPIMYPEDNCVDVRYQVFIRDLFGGGVEVLQETHRMRYLFQPEIEFLARQAGFQLVKAGEWLTGTPLSFTSWNAFFVCRK